MWPVHPSARLRDGGAERGGKPSPAPPPGVRPAAASARVLALLGLLAAVATGGCRGCGRPPVEVDRVLVSSSDVAAHPALGLDADGLRRHVEAALAAGGRFRLATAPGRRGGTHARLRLDGTAILPGPDGDGRIATVALELDLVGERRRQAAGRGEAPLPDAPGERARAFVLALDRALEQAVAGLATQLEAEAATDGELVVALSADDPERRELALRLLVERRSPAAVDPLLARLDDPQPEEVLRAASALAAIGDPRAAPALIEAASRRDPAFVARIATALGDLGGPEAEAYLFTASAGHPDPGVRAAAEEALATLRSSRRGR